MANQSINYSVRHEYLDFTHGEVIGDFPSLSDAYMCYDYFCLEVLEDIETCNNATGEVAIEKQLVLLDEGGDVEEVLEVLECIVEREFEENLIGVS